MPTARAAVAGRAFAPRLLRVRPRLPPARSLGGHAAAPAAVAWLDGTTASAAAPNDATTTAAAMLTPPAAPAPPIPALDAADTVDSGVVGPFQTGLDLFQSLLLWVHDATGLPWWASICLTTLG